MELAADRLIEPLALTSSVLSTQFAPLCDFTRVFFQAVTTPLPTIISSTAMLPVVVTDANCLAANS